MGAKQYITIPIPFELPRNKGVLSLREHGHQTTVRFHDDMYKLLCDTAASLGLSPGAFIRFVTMYSVKEVIKQQTGKEVEVYL